ncbi:hypothetical protein TNCV_2820171 [Trichonephila clavipes]|nr:hypothetical protein TNCV_2820171 [Trichonephila clavipes]
MPPNTLRADPNLHAEIVDVEIEVVSPSIVPSGNFAELKSYCHLYGAQGQRQVTSCPCHGEFRGPRSDYVRQLRQEQGEAPIGVKALGPSPVGPSLRRPCVESVESLSLASCDIPIP